MVVKERGGRNGTNSLRLTRVLPAMTPCAARLGDIRAPVNEPDRIADRLKTGGWRRNPRHRTTEATTTGAIDTSYVGSSLLSAGTALVPRGARTSMVVGIFGVHLGHGARGFYLTWAIWMDGAYRMEALFALPRKGGQLVLHRGWLGVASAEFQESATRARAHTERGVFAAENCVAPPPIDQS